MTAIRDVRNLQDKMVSVFLVHPIEEKLVIHGTLVDILSQCVSIRQGVAGEVLDSIPWENIRALRHVSPITPEDGQESLEASATITAPIV